MLMLVKKLVWPIRESLCSQYMQKFRELFKSQKSLLLN